MFACLALSFVDMKELTTDEIVEVNGEKRDSRQTPQDQCSSSKAARHTLADNRTVQAPFQRQTGIRRNQLLDDVQTVEKSNQRMWHREANLLPLCPSYLRNVGF